MRPYTSLMSRDSRRTTPGTFPLFGFPTSIRPGFAVFLVILAVLYPFPLGLWVAGAVAVFTVIHELGHALAARRYECDASISLDFMVAYATYKPPRPLSWNQKIAISLAGPSLQVATASLVLLAVGVNPFSRDDIASSEMSAAVWWAGIALGLVNLIPLTPLDGGAVVAEIAERVSPNRGRTLVMQVSFAVTVIAGALCVFFGLIGLLPLFAFMLLMQYQQLFLPQRLKRALSQRSLTPEGRPEMDESVLAMLLEIDENRHALDYATAAYVKCPSFACAFGAARAAHALGDTALSDAWLQAARSSQFEENQMTVALRHHPELVPGAARLGLVTEPLPNR